MLASIRLITFHQQEARSTLLEPCTSIISIRSAISLTSKAGSSLNGPTRRNLPEPTSRSGDGEERPIIEVRREVKDDAFGNGGQELTPFRR